MKYEYGLQFRPAGIGAVPIGPFKIQERLSDPEAARYTRHGVIVYDRPLAESEIRSFELAVIADEHLRAEIAIAVALEMLEYVESYLEIWTETPEDFRVMAMSRVCDLRPYAVYVGDSMSFCRMVAARLETGLEMARRGVSV